MPKPPHERIAIIYKIENSIDGKVYVGSTISFKNRWKCHRSHLRAGTHHSRYLQFAWRKHGEEAFCLSVLQRCASHIRTHVEQFWIDYLRAADPEHGYNACPQAMSCTGKKHSEETKEKIRRAHLGRPKSELHRARVSAGQRGRTASPETRAKLSAALKGKKRTPEQIQKSVEARRGFRHSNESRARLSEVAKRRPPPSEETRRKLSEAGRGRKWSESQRAKMAAREPRPLTTENRHNLSASRGGRPFVIVAPDGARYHFRTLSEASSLGLDSSNVHKCLLGRAKQTKGYRCYYSDPQGVC